MGCILPIETMPVLVKTTDDVANEFQSSRLHRNLLLQLIFPLNNLGRRGVSNNQQAIRGSDFTGTWQRCHSCIGGYAFIWTQTSFRSGDKKLVSSSCMHNSLTPSSNSICRASSIWKTNLGCNSSRTPLMVAGTKSVGTDSNDICTQRGLHK